MEVVDGWRAKLHPRIPTWREMYSRRNRHIHVGHSSLADSIRQKLRRELTTVCLDTFTAH